MAEFGVGIRRMSPLAVAELNVTPHLRAILTTITDLAARRSYDGMDRWLHTLGYRGAFTTKSRLFSTTMGALRAYRAAWTRQQHAEQAATTKDAQHRRATASSDAIAMGIRSGRTVQSRRACPDPVGGTADDRTPPHSAR